LEVNSDSTNRGYFYSTEDLNVPTNGSYILEFDASIANSNNSTQETETFTLKIKEALRSCIHRDSRKFRPSPGKPSGWWELTSFQEEIAEMKAEIQTLKEENERLRAVPTEDDFVDRFVMQVKTFLKRDTDTVDEIRKILVALNRSDAAKNLDSWIDEHNTPLVSIDKAQDVIASGGKKIVNNR